MPGGFIKVYGLYHDNEQIGFQCFAEYSPWRNKRAKRILHSNRTVIHPDYCGLGLGIKMVNEGARLLYKEGHRIMAKFSNIAMYKSRLRDKDWKLFECKLDATGGPNFRGGGNAGVRRKVKTWHFEYIPIDK